MKTTNNTCRYHKKYNTIKCGKKNATQTSLRMKCIISLKIVHDDELFILCPFKNRSVVLI